MNIHSECIIWFNASFRTFKFFDYIVFILRLRFAFSTLFTAVFLLNISLNYSSSAYNVAYTFLRMYAKGPPLDIPPNYKIERQLEKNGSFLARHKQTKNNFQGNSIKTHTQRNGQWILLCVSFNVILSSCHFVSGYHLPFYLH